MVLKNRHFAFAILLLIVFSGISCGENLLIGGIGQKGPTVDENDDYKTIKNGWNAEYVPTYYTGSKEKDAYEVRNASLGIATDQNGLTRDELHDNHYNTIIGYSGGTATVVTALADPNYKLTCDKLILISPMAAGIPDNHKKEVEKRLSRIQKINEDATIGIVPKTATTIGQGIGIGIEGKLADNDANRKFEEQIRAILINNPGIKIQVIQSPQDVPVWYGRVFQYTFNEKYLHRFGEENIESFQITTVNDLKSTGEDAHKDLFYKYAVSHLANDGDGITFSPTGQSIAKPNQLSGSKFPDWMNSQSKTASGLESWGKHPKGWGVSQEYVNAHPEIYGYPSPTPSSPQSGSNSGSSGSSTPDISAIEDAIRREFADPNSQLVQDLQANAKA